MQFTENSALKPLPYLQFHAYYPYMSWNQPAVSSALKPLPYLLLVVPISDIMWGISRIEETNAQVINPTPPSGLSENKA